MRGSAGINSASDRALGGLAISAQTASAAGGTLGLVSNSTSDSGVRRQQADALFASDQRYRSLFEYAPDGILIADRQGRYVDANKAMCRMLGYPYEELVGLHSADIVVAAEVANIGPALTAIKTEPDYHREWEFQRRDGTTFCADVMATVMPDGNLMAFVRDNTAASRTGLRGPPMSGGDYSHIVRTRHLEMATHLVLDWSDELLRLLRRPATSPNFRGVASRRAS